MDPNKENPFVNILANIILPVFILNKTAHFPGDNKALWALGAALIFPLSYGLWDLFKNSKTNYFSILGLINTLITGLLAVFGLGGIWFAIKEAAFPAILGVGAYMTSIKNKPFIKTFIGSSGLLNMPLIESTSKEKLSEGRVEKAFLKANNLFSISFFISAFLNFALALYIFRPIKASIVGDEKAIILNEQISKMTWAGMLVIAVPMMFFLAATLYTLLKGLQEATGLNQEEILTPQ